MDIPSLIDKAGGSMAVAVDLGISQVAVIGWVQRRKIPGRYWDYFIKKVGVTHERLYSLNYQNGHKKKS